MLKCATRDILLRLAPRASRASATRRSPSAATTDLGLQGPPSAAWDSVPVACRGPAMASGPVGSVSPGAGYRAAPMPLRRPAPHRAPLRRHLRRAAGCGPCGSDCRIGQSPRAGRRGGNCFDDALPTLRPARAGASAALLASLIEPRGERVAGVAGVLRDRCAPAWRGPIARGPRPGRNSRAEGGGSAAES